MENPFESGHIKNYIYLYASVVVIMILFFIASTLFNDVQSVDKKVFSTKVKESEKDSNINKDKESNQNSLKSRFKLMDKSY